ncbi:2-hydroxychromene-2-carboxylate isomerase [Allopusillimonas ginsengisoli]|uniref:2-hydroxychromene-2-carboxylate isomerase n=1 Tax=Allopusillimonas ginsengisoli TaxID=453575 RepID=UPI0010221E0B|nr:2-hydroxychromene-2-carboxylate isomerase [Allopusillimonas ginsengisoli]TEA78886.1 2-hydroxychromene-2-carboxylate isomerase [Allopusillimonas ginsengisoli]
MKTITYFFSPQSPWTYFGHDRLVAIAEKHGAVIDPRPCALNQAVFPASGGLPLKQRALQRVKYRLVELERWSNHLRIPLRVNPKHFPVDETLASLMITLAVMREGHEAGVRLTGGMLRAVWAQDRNIADKDTLIAVSKECGLDGASLYADREAAREQFDHYTQDAIERQVFGAPWYIYNQEPFWGQDRLEFLDRALAG